LKGIGVEMYCTNVEKVSSLVPYLLIQLGFEANLPKHLKS